MQHLTSRTVTSVLKATLLLAMLATYVSHNAQAAVGFNIQPLRIDMSARTRSSSLELTNLTDRDIPIQIKAYTWSQKDGRDVLNPTRDIFLAPPITNVKAGGKQIVRFRLKKGAGVDKEKSYRIFVEQIPPGDPSLRAAMEFRLRFSVPLFVAPSRFSDPSFTATATKVKGGVKVGLENSGNIHLRVKSIAAYQDEIKSDAITPDEVLASVTNSVTGNSYALQGTRQEWFIPLTEEQLQSTPLNIAISTDFFNATGRGRVGRDGVIRLPIDGSAVNSDGN